MDLTITIDPVILVGTRRQTMLITCKKCNVQHDARDVNNGICIWCEQKENTEIQMLLFENSLLFIIKSALKERNHSF